MKVIFRCFLCVGFIFTGSLSLAQQSSPDSCQTEQIAVHIGPGGERNFYSCHGSNCDDKITTLTEADLKNLNAHLQNTKSATRALAIFLAAATVSRTPLVRSAIAEGNPSGWILKSAATKAAQAVGAAAEATSITGKTVARWTVGGLLVGLPQPSLPKAIDYVFATKKPDAGKSLDQLGDKQSEPGCADGPADDLRLFTKLSKLSPDPQAEKAECIHKDSANARRQCLAEAEENFNQTLALKNELSLPYRLRTMPLDRTFPERTPAGEARILMSEAQK